VRVTPHLFTQPKELDKLVASISRFSNSRRIGSANALGPATRLA
jgi:hypothetical protein